MHITDLVAKELGLSNVVEQEPSVTINGVTVVELQSAEGLFRVHLVRDAPSTNVSLEVGSKLAAYFNSLFWHETLPTLKIDVPISHFKTSFNISDGNVQHSVFITRLPSVEGRSLHFLGMSELEQVARQIATLHAVQSSGVLEEFRTAVAENYGNITSYRKKIQKEVIEILKQAVNSEVSQFFVNPANILEKVGILTHHLDNSTSGDGLVISHGRLTADTCRFDEHGTLVEITEWENIHLGSPVEDLTNLIVSSASPEIRRKKFMKIFQVYFYTLVDLQPPNFQLPDLKKWFRENMARAVVDGIETLLLTLSESPDLELKKSAANRWETSLDDTVDFLTSNYMSDDEQVFFSHKDE